MGQARGDEGLQLPLFVQDGDATVAGAGQGTGPSTTPRRTVSWSRVSVMRILAWLMRERRSPGS